MRTGNRRAVLSPESLEGRNLQSSFGGGLVELNPQPLPPGRPAEFMTVDLNPQPLPPGRYVKPQ